MSRRQKIERLGLQSPIVRQCLDAHRYQVGVSYQDALEEMVVALAEALAATQAMHLDHLNRCATPSVALAGAL